MARDLPPPSQRRGGLVSWLDDFYQAWRSSRVIRSDAVELHETPGGTLLYPTAAGALAAASAAVEGRTLILYDASDANGPRLGVSYGVIANREPKGFKPGGVPPYTISVSETGYVFAYGAVNARGNGFTEAGLAIANSLDYTRKNSVVRFLGSFKASRVSGGFSVAVTQGVFGPIEMNPCEASP